MLTELIIGGGGVGIFLAWAVLSEEGLDDKQRKNMMGSKDGPSKG